MMNQVRYEKYAAAKKKGYDFISYISSNISSMEEIHVGENCFILERQIINFDVKIGNNITIWSGNHLGDSLEIMDHCWISSCTCIAGNVVIRPFSVIGIHASISHNVTIAKRSFIGANALISQNTTEKGVYIVPNTPKASLNTDKFMAMVRDTH